MILGDILLIIEGLMIILICLLDFPPEVTKIYEIDIVIALLATIFGFIMLVVGIHQLNPDIHNYVSTRKKSK